MTRQGLSRFRPLFGTPYLDYNARTHPSLTWALKCISYMGMSTSKEPPNTDVSHKISNTVYRFMLATAKLCPKASRALSCMMKWRQRIPGVELSNGIWHAYICGPKYDFAIRWGNFKDAHTVYTNTWPCPPASQKLYFRVPLPAKFRKIHEFGCLFVINIGLTEGRGV